MIMSPGYWPGTYWSNLFWTADYWPEWGGAIPVTIPAPAMSEFSSNSLQPMAWLALQGERRPHLRSIFRANRLKREEDEIRKMHKRNRRKPIDRH